MEMTKAFKCRHEGQARLGRKIARKIIRNYTNFNELYWI